MLTALILAYVYCFMAKYFHVIIHADIAVAVSWYCVETAQPIVKLSSLPGSPMILVF